MKPIKVTPPQTWQFSTPTLCAALLLAVGTSFALPSYDSNCRGCHTTVRSGMTLTNFQTTTNLGAGLLKVFQVKPGQTLPIQLWVTNTYNNYYGLSIDSLGGPGAQNAAHLMSFSADPAWTDEGGWFTQGPMTTSPQVWTFNLAIATNTPADFYPVGTQMAGLSSSKWSQVETFYVQVLPNSAPRPMLMSTACNGHTFSVQVPTASGFTYYLEYKTNWNSSSWTTVSQAPGDGTTRMLSDMSATDPQRLYRIRVQ